MIPSRYHLNESWSFDLPLRIDTVVSVEYILTYLLILGAELAPRCWMDQLRSLIALPLISFLLFIFPNHPTFRIKFHMFLDLSKVNIAKVFPIFVVSLNIYYSYSFSLLKHTAVYYVPINHY